MEIDNIGSVIRRHYPDLITADNKYIFDYYVSALRNTKDIRNINQSEALRCAIKCIKHNILVDGIGCSLIVRYGKLIIHETLKKTTSRIAERLNLILYPAVFSHSQIAFAKRERIVMPDSPAELPAGEHTHALSMLQAHSVLVKAVKNGEVSHREIYPISRIYSIARIEVVDEVAYSIHITSKGKNRIRAQSPWQSPSDSLEMIKKTAVKQFIKYFSLVTLTTETKGVE